MPGTRECLDNSASAAACCCAAAGPGYRSHEPTRCNDRAETRHRQRPYPGKQPRPTADDSTSGRTRSGNSAFGMVGSPTSSAGTNHKAAAYGDPQGQATYGMANLRPEKTGLPFIAFISQRDNAQHAVRVKVAKMPKVNSSEMGTYALSPFEWKAGIRLSSQEERKLEQWIALNQQVINDYWSGAIAYTEDAIAAIVKV